MPVTEDEKVIYKFLRSKVFKRYICILLCLVLYVTVLPFPVSAEEAKTQTVRVGWYEGIYNTTGSDGQRRGYSYEYQQAVAAHTGWKYEYVEGSWAELMNMLKSTIWMHLQSVAGMKWKQSFAYVHAYSFLN